MSSSLHSRIPLFAASLLVIVLTSLYLANVAIPLQTQHIGASTVVSASGPRAEALAADAGTGGRAGGWSALAMAFLAVPTAAGLAFAATNARLVLSPAERVLWLLISVASLTLFFLTAMAANVFFEDLLG